jgi:lipopolysaccharide export system permease protein
MTLDLLGESGKILAVAGNGEAELWKYVSLRVPMLISRFLPFSLLLGALITFTTLNQHSEVIAMKAAGISAHQILAPLIVASLFVAGAAFVFNEFVVTKSVRVVTAWDDNDYKPLPPDSGILSNVWLLAGDDLVRARQVMGNGASVRAMNVTLYERDDNRLVRVIDAEQAVPVNGAWLLKDARIFDSQMSFVRRLAELRALEGVEPARFTLAKVDPDERDFFSLRHAIAELEAAGRPTSEAEAGLWHKVVSPLSSLLMPLLAAVAAFGLARSGKVLLRAVVGMALGFSYFVADNFGIAMGNVGAYPPLLAAWAPFFLFLLIGETVLVRSEE